jgi:hypothetical protein
MASGFGANCSDFARGSNPHWRMSSLPGKMRANHNNTNTKKHSMKTTIPILAALAFTGTAFAGERVLPCK